MVKHKWDKASLSSMREAANRVKEQTLLSNPVFAKAYERAKANAKRTAEEQYWINRSAELDVKIAELRRKLRPIETRVYIRVGSSDPNCLRKPKRRRVRVKYHYEYFISLWGKLIPTSLQEALQHGYKEENLIAKKVTDKEPMLLGDFLVVRRENNIVSYYTLFELYKYEVVWTDFILIL